MTDSEINKGRKSNTQIAVEEIKRLIINNRLSAGSNHLESELSELLGMSRTPVREATLILQAQGLLSVQPRRGVKISEVSASDMSEIYQILAVLEARSAQLAALNKLTDAQLKPMQNAISEMDKALENDDRDAWAVADASFHSELVRLGGNSRIADIVDMYNDQVRRVRSITLHMRPAPVQSNDDHRKVLEAICQGDDKSAYAIHVAHRDRAGVMLTELLSKFGIS